MKCSGKIAISHQDSNPGTPCMVVPWERRKGEFTLTSAVLILRGRGMLSLPVKDQDGLAR